MNTQVKTAAAFILTGVGFYAIAYISGWSLKPVLEDEPLTYSKEEIERVRDLREDNFSPENAPVIYREVDYTKGAKAPWYPKGESPFLAELVAEGKLPPVAERVGEEPLVLEGVDGIGKYGGTWLRVSDSEWDVRIIKNRMSYPRLVRWSPMGHPIVPHMAKGWEHSDDLREWTFFLRKGMKWSDGHPFTSRDILFYWNYTIKARGPTKVPDWMKVAGHTGEVYAVDDYTVKFVFPLPNTVFLEVMASASSVLFTPEHYLKQYHWEVGDDALCEATMEARKIPTRRALFSQMGDWNNPECPKMNPWVYRTHKANPPQGFVRNPYYWAVDTQGNQLPYIDRVQFDVMASKLVPSAAINGAITMQARYIRYDDYTLLMSERESGGYEVLHWDSAVRSVWTLFPNLNRSVDPAEPATAMKAELLDDKRFRQALSLAINRKQIINAEYNGVGEPAQLSPGKESDFYSRKLQKSYTEYKPERANRLLDELGLTRYDEEGFRTYKDGTRMVWYIAFTDFTGPGPSQFIIDDWEAVGIRAIARERARPFFRIEKRARKQDFTVWTAESAFNPLLEPRNFLPVDGESSFASGYGFWFQRGGLAGDPAAEEAGSIEPPPGNPIREGQELLAKALVVPDREEQKRIIDELFDIVAENVWSISISTPPPQLVVVKDGFKNVPRHAVFSSRFYTPGNAGLETYYFTDPQDSPGAIELSKREILEPVLAPTALAEGSLEPQKGNGGISRFITYLVWGLLIAGLIHSGVRHPYVGRRLIIMIPTLLVTAVLTFIIIQIPPGDFIQTKILEAQMTQDQEALDQVEELREVFPFDEPITVQFAKWMGLYWFSSFDPKDTGLLQGNLGRVMETRKTVNEVVGDRITLTVLISLGTILFTWALAIPIGIYSAVRQYSMSDYVVTFLGFIGMCVPNFLLAIILMYWAGKFFGIEMSGLFSSEYATQPEWTWGKVGDLLKHIWVPVVVLGAGGTAEMIRVMRGNLLDELKKPYVITAMAKGVRPFKLLMKYPVRIALNPFISGIGSLFPKLVSGGAIVAMVLSLPTVGPLMLSALLTEDMYLAGSMLMVLSLLGVFGTLVSDLLLLWLDPRIRMEGGNR